MSSMQVGLEAIDLRINAFHFSHENTFQNNFQVVILQFSKFVSLAYMFAQYNMQRQYFPSIIGNNLNFKHLLHVREFKGRVNILK